MDPAARLTDIHSCPMLNPDESPHVGGPIAEGEWSVQIGELPAARCGDQAACVGATDVIVTGAWSVLIDDRPAARQGDQTAHGGVVVVGESTVLIGSDGAGAGGATGATMRAAQVAGRPFCELCEEGQGEC